MINEHIDYKELATHFRGDRSVKSANEAFRQLKRKWKNEKKGLWLTYVKAYNFDKGIKNDD